MTIDHAYFHEVCIKVLYAIMVLITFVLAERLMYHAFVAMRARSIWKILRKARLAPEVSVPEIKGRDELSRGLTEYIGAQQRAGITRDAIEDLGAALYLRMSNNINARLWLLDTAVTAAPLLGLLGTILGIMDTFNALSAGGISDPSAVSRGISSALIATAIGIGTALYGLLANNLLRRQADAISDSIKESLLIATV